MKLLTSLVLIALIGTGNGRQHSKINIIGGRKANQGEIPYILSQQIGNSHSCGASLIEVQGIVLAISAAHCTAFMDENMRNQTYVVAGELKLSNSSGIEQRIKVSEIVEHDWDPFTNENDINLLFLEESIQFNDNIKLIRLPSPGNTTSGSIQVSGWGLTEEGGNSASDDLMTVNIPVVTDEVCREIYSSVGLSITANMLCAGKLGEGGVDSCQMDSGGPAVQDEKLVGIVSFGLGCGRADFPGVYAEVAYFLNWINDNVESYKRRQKAKRN